MSEVVKWGLLVAGLLVIIALIVALPFVEFIDFGEFGNLITQLVSLCSSAFSFGRGLINNFLTPFGRTVLTGIMIYLIGKWAITIGIKITSWAYHFIFK